MNAFDATPIVPRETPAPLRARRCVRHVTREAAARCPACGGDFCRECVSEFEGKLLCADCLAKAAKTRATRTRRWPVVREALAFGGAVVLAWISFYGIGRLALKLPENFHHDTLWAEDGGTNR